jgi:hypothetical protein
MAIVKHKLHSVNARYTTSSQAGLRGSSRVCNRARGSVALMISGLWWLSSRSPCLFARDRNLTDNLLSAVEERADVNARRSAMWSLQVPDGTPRVR